MEKIRIKAGVMMTKYNNRLIFKRLWRECIVNTALKKAAG